MKIKPNIPLISRQNECEALQKCLESNRSEFVVISGRRRVGKTYLVDTFFNGVFDFSFVGAHNAEAKIQLLDFAKALRLHSGNKCKTPANWYAAFDMLEEFLGSKPHDGKLTIFIDEMPWIDTPKSDFVTALERFWNSWANRRKDVMLIATGSATSWMADKLIGNKGGLHARITCNLHLSPFTLKETEEYLRSIGCQWDRYQILQTYMVFGGVPFYLSLIDPLKSSAQNIDRLFFASNAQLKLEFEELYNALFTRADNYVETVKLLSQHQNGLTRKEISEGIGIEGGFLTKILNNLERCDFISSYTHYGNKKRETVFRLTDFYTLFYYKFLSDSNRHNAKWWQTHLGSQGILSWMGTSFEIVGMLHVEQIKNALGISGISVDISTWKSNAKKKPEIPGFQIDLILERGDRTIHLCEMKFCNGQYPLTSEYENKLRNRSTWFRLTTKTTKTVIHTFVTTYGVANVKNHSLVHSEVTMDDLFNS